MAKSVPAMVLSRDETKEFANASPQETESMRNQRRLHARNAEKRSAGGASLAREEATDEHCGFPAPTTSRLDADYHELATVVHKQLSIFPARTRASMAPSSHAAFGHGLPQTVTALLRVMSLASKLGAMVHLLTGKQHFDCSLIRRKDVNNQISELWVAPHCRSCFSAHTC